MWNMTFLGTLTLAMAAGPLSAAETGDADGLLRTLTGLDPESIAVPLKVLVVVTILGAVPSVVLLTTCFPRILIVFSFLRRALGTQDLPPNQVVAGFTMILTVLIMMPVWKKIHDDAYLPYRKGEIRDGQVALDRAATTLKQFMLAHTLESDLRLFIELSERPATGGEQDRSREPTVDAQRTVENLNFFVVLPAFVLSELKVAFQMGFLLYLPFLVIDLAVSAVLISMGMFMLPPVLVSLPLKVLVFVLADGWNLIVGQLVASVQVIQ